jgi:YVTN family beta-propeller protein
VPYIVDERPTAPAGASHGGLARQRRWRLRFLLSALGLGIVACLVVLATGALNSLSPVPSPSARSVAVTPGGTGVVHVLASTGQVRAGASFAELNGIADGLGGVWVTGGYARQNHILYAVDPASGRVVGKVELPSRVVINPNDVAIGGGAVWAAVGASVYRVQPVSALSGAAVVTRAFAALPPDGVIGDLVVDAGALWVSDTTHGKVYRFAASTGRLEAVVPVGGTAGAMAVGDGGVWVADVESHTVSRISVTDNRVDSVLTFPGPPNHIAATGNGLWVTDGTGDVAAALNGDHGRIRTVPVGAGPTGLAAAGDTVWVASTASGTLSRIDARHPAVVATVRVGVRPYAVAADRQGAWVAVLGQPVMDAPPGSSGSLAQEPAWLLRLCGVG